MQDAFANVSFIDVGELGGYDALLIYFGITLVYVALVYFTARSLSAAVVSALTLYGIAIVAQALIPGGSTIVVLPLTFGVGYAAKLFWLRFEPKLAANGAQKKSGTWSFVIPALNALALGGSLLLLLGVDVPIVQGAPQYANLLNIMFGILAVSVAFYFYETFELRRRFKEAAMTYDWFFALFVLVRNLFLVVNFVPLVHLGALMVMPIAAPVILILYYALVRARLTAAASFSNPTQSAITAGNGGVA